MAGPLTLVGVRPAPLAPTVPVHSQERGTLTFTSRITLETGCHARSTSMRHRAKAAPISGLNELDDSNKNNKWSATCTVTI